MNIANTKDLKAVIDSVLKPRGFLGRKFTWYKHCETILVVNLQKDDFGGQFYVNLGIAVRPLVGSLFLREEHCHTRIRLDRILRDSTNVLSVFNLEDETIVSSDRLARVRESMLLGAEWLEQLSTLKALAEAVKSDTVFARHSVKVLHEWLEENF